MTISISRWLFLLAYYSYALAPTPAPRFDVLAEKLLGDWNDVTVKEVMRSCGGAVQGLEDVMTSKDVLYLNRANDGWVYWNDGSYSLGSVQKDESPFQTCFCAGDWRIVIQHTEDAIMDHLVLSKNNMAPTVALVEAPHVKDWSAATECTRNGPAWLLQRCKWQGHGTMELLSDDAQTINVWYDSGVIGVSADEQHWCIGREYDEKGLTCVSYRSST